MVFGAPKSGTSVVAQLLSIGSGGSATIDIPTLWRTPVQEVRNGNTSAAQLIGHHRAYFSRDVIKEPGLTSIMDLIVSEMGVRKVVFVVRDPLTNIRSLLQRRGIPGDLDVLSQDQMKRLVGGSWHWTYDWPYRNTKASADWFGGRHYVEALAAQWQSGVDAWVRTRQMDVEPFVLRYEDFLVDKMTAIESIMDQFGLAMRHDISEHLDKQFQPKGDHTVSVESFFGPRNMEHILRETEQGVSLFGYQTQDFV